MQHRRRAWSGLFAVLLWAIGFVAIAALPARVDAAAPEFQVVTDTTYLARPGDRLVHVVVNGSATSYKPDTATQRYYYTSAVLVVLGGATDFSASAAGVGARVTVLEQDDHQVAVQVGLNRSVFYRQTATFRLEFDLPTGAAAGDVRVGSNVAAFPVWAVGTPETPGSTVTISLPPDFELQVDGETLPEPTARDDGGTLFRWGPLDDPLNFFPYAVADNPVVTEGTFTDFPTSVEIGDTPVDVTVQAWADDAAWGQRVSDRLTEGLPVLAGIIDLPYICTERLIVTETVPRTIGGYAGIFDTCRTRARIEIAYDADEGVTLHEAAHAWFNDQLASERWILEGFASYYAEVAARKLGVDGGQIELTDDLRPAAFPLSEWGAVGVEERNAELYGYGASLQAARDLATRAGLTGLSTVWGEMLDRRSAYQPLDPSQTETFSGRADWRYLLDLLEERTRKSYRDIFEQWVTRPEDATILDQRQKTRLTYHDLLDTAGDWDLPRQLRRDMSSWDFTAAGELMDRVSAVLALRDGLRAHATNLGLELPSSMQAAFTAGQLTTATEIAGELDTALTAIDEAQAADDGEDALEWIGLIGSDPAAELAAARQAVSDGAPDDATREARAARDTWTNAAATGTTRAVIAGGVLVFLLVAGTGTFVLLRRRRRRRRVTTAAAMLAQPAPELPAPAAAPGPEPMPESDGPGATDD